MTLSCCSMLHPGCTTLLHGTTALLSVCLGTRHVEAQHNRLVCALSLCVSVVNERWRRQLVTAWYLDEQRVWCWNHSVTVRTCHYCSDERQSADRRASLIQTLLLVDWVTTGTAVQYGTVWIACCWWCTRLFWDDSVECAFVTCTCVSVQCTWWGQKTVWPRTATVYSLVPSTLLYAVVRLTNLFEWRCHNPQVYVGVQCCSLYITTFTSQLGEFLEDCSTEPSYTT